MQIMQVHFIEIQGFSNDFPYTIEEVHEFNDCIQDNNVVIINYHSWATVAIRKTGKSMAEFSISIRRPGDIANTNIGAAHAMQRMITGQCLPCFLWSVHPAEVAIKIAEALI